MKFKSTIYLVIFMATILITNQIAYSQSRTVKVAVQIYVDSPDSVSIEQRLMSFIKRELRLLNDVEVVSKNENLTLRILAMENISRNGEYKYGFTLSAISLFSLYCEKVFVKAFWGSTMFTCGESSLGNISENIVVWFDRNSIESIRNYRSK